jgi:hypothetical protein
MRALREFGSAHDDLTTFFYEHNFPDWFIKHARGEYSFDWREIIPALRNTRFIFTDGYFDSPGANITGTSYLSKAQAVSTGETLIERLTALAATLLQGEPVRRSLELDGFRADPGKLTIEPSDSAVNEQQEENLLVGLVKQCRLPNEGVILRHLGDAHELFVQGKDHASIGESRNLIQALIDDMSAATHASVGYSIGYPNGMANRLQYLQAAGSSLPMKKLHSAPPGGSFLRGRIPVSPRAMKRGLDSF